MTTFWVDYQVLTYWHYFTFKEDFNPVFPNAPSLYPLETSENLTVFWCFQGIEKECIGNEWDNMFRNPLPPLARLIKSLSMSGSGLPVQCKKFASFNFELIYFLKSPITYTYCWWNYRCWKGVMYKCPTEFQSFR